MRWPGGSLNCGMRPKEEILILASGTPRSTAVPFLGSASSLFCLLSLLGHKLLRQSAGNPNMLNGIWNVVQVIFVAYFFVETKGKTLEETDASFDWKKHSDVPDLEEPQQISVMDEVDLKVNFI
ncbi:hypothetical protein DPV78_012414 [Talaromyces pinophilus]|nr:hypothetical protein DPV78_012414 [Talaromyces pinophilus]